MGPVKEGPRDLAALSRLWLHAPGFSQGLLFGLFKGGDMDVDVEVDVDIGSYFGCLKGVSKSVQVLLTVKETIMVLTLMLK